MTESQKPRDDFEAANGGTLDLYRFALKDFQLSPYIMFCFSIHSLASQLTFYNKKNVSQSMKSHR